MCPPPSLTGSRFDSKPQTIETTKPSEKKPEIVYRIIDTKTGRACGSYSRACCDEYDFESAHQARNANVCGTFKNRQNYQIAKYRVTYEIIDQACDWHPDGFTQNKRGHNSDPTVGCLAGPEALRQEFTSGPVAFRA